MAGAPGGVLESITVTVPGGPSIVTATSSMSIVLTVGTTYWITTQALDTFAGGWNFTDPVTNVGIADSFDGASTWSANPGSTDSALRVNGSSVRSVPEPGSLALVGMGVVSLALVGLRRQRTLVAARV